MTDSDMDQPRHGNSNPEPTILVSSGHILQPNIPTVATASGNTSNLESHYVPNVYDNAETYRGTQYNASQNQHNLDMGGAAVTNLHYSGTNPSSSTGVFPLPTNHIAYDQLPASSTFSVSGVSSDNFGRSSSYAADVRATFKRKNAETFRGNAPHFDASASSSVVPPNARHSDGVTMMDPTSLPLPQYPVNNFPSPMELGPHGSLWSRSVESVMIHEHSHLIQGNYLGQPFQSVAPPWLDQPLNNCHCDGHATAWNQSLPMPYMQAAPNANGSSLENANMGLQRYHDAASNMNGLRRVHPPVSHQHHNYHHHPAMTRRGFRGHNINFQPPVTAASYRVPINPLHNAVIPVQNGFEMGHRHVGLVPSAGMYIYHPHRGYMYETVIGHQNLHPTGYLQVDDVAVLDEVGLIDHHREMRLDIEDMTYEELLALGEQIGIVRTGLSEESISASMKTRVHATVINLEEEETPEGEEAGPCIICLENYKDREKIGILPCGHEYHADCVKTWLIEKNICPICKEVGLTPEEDKGV